MDNFEIERERLKRRRAVSDALIAQSLKPMGGTEVVSGVAVRRSPVEGFAKLGEAYFGKQRGDAVDAAEQDLQSKQRMDIASAIGDYQKATTARPESYSGEAGTADELYTPAFAPNEKDRQGAALTLAGRVGNPSDTAKLLVADALKPKTTKTVDLGDAIGVMDEQGNILQRLPKAATPDARLSDTRERDKPVAVETAGPTGAPQTSFVRPFFQTAPLPKPVKSEMVNTGATTVPVNPFTQAEPLKNTASPSAVLASDTARRGQDMSQGTAIRGQDMTDARTREQLDQGKVSDTQRTAAAYADRMTRAEELLGGLTTGAKAIDGKPGLVETAAGAVGSNVGANMARGTERQQYHQAQEDWVRAKLRKESGAVIADEEMAREIRTYFPQIGDNPEVIAQKTAARNLATEAMGNEAGRAKRAYSGVERRGLPSADAIDAELARRKAGG
jgi:hypothetical protein